MSILEIIRGSLSDILYSLFNFVSQSPKSREEKLVLCVIFSWSESVTSKITFFVIIMVFCV